MEKARPLVIFGATSNGDLFELIDACNRAGDGPGFQPVAFLDDQATLHGQSVHGVPVVGPLDAARDFEDAWFLNAIGTPATVGRRRSFLERAGVSRARFATFVHPQAIVSPSSRIGNGCLVFAGAVIGAEVELGICSDVMPNAVLSHGCRIGDFTFIASGVMLGGSVRIDEACFLGLNCSVRDRVTIGARCVVGQGSVVLNNVPEATVAVGNPARKLRDAAF